MVVSRRRTSLLGVLALLSGVAALVLTKFNPTPWQVVTVGSMTLPLGAAVALGAAAVALLAFLAAASSPRTGTGLPVVAILVCAAALALAFKPGLFARRAAPAAAAKPAGPTTAPASEADSPAPADSPNTPHVKTIFDSDYPSSTPTPAAPHEPAVRPDAAAPAGESPGAPAKSDRAEAIRAARAKLDAARAEVVRSLESSPAYRAAKSDADAADAELKQARLVNPPGSPELVAASEAAMAAHSKLQKLITDAAAKDPAFQEATRALRAVP